ncbi:MAG: COX15/CtaA family protein [Anaerolineales bacterium]|nr:COX15/CtaA family protein [Anaerolineales bacterium]MDW8446533.1 COX15/CtaA family protein [Anaerolineales bacterium]
MSTGSLVGSFVRQDAFKRFSNFALAILILNILVILWGVVVRATGSGAGCGSHWPLCNGEVIPLDPKVETLIEFSHRLSSGLALLGVVALFALARRAFGPNHAVRRFAFLALVFMVIESLIGAVLVLFELVGRNASATRAVVISLHLLNTLVLLGFLALTWWRSRFPQAKSEISQKTFPSRRNVFVFAIAILLIGSSGAIAALGNTLFPSSTLVEGLRQDLNPTAHFLIRLRVFHPIFGLVGAGLVLSIIYRALEADTRPLVRKLGWGVIVLGAVQLVGGFFTLILLAPTWLQMFHLFFADLLWIVFVLFIDTKRNSYL